MENAVKALLIAAAVLVAILLISFGVGIFTSAEEQMGNADLTEYQVQQFNQKFTKFQGKQSGSEINALIDTVFNHNMQQTDAAMCVQLKNNTTEIIKAAVATADQSLPSKVSTGKNYEVTITVDKTTGRVKTITFK